MRLTLYTTNCPRCKVLEKKMAELGLEYEKVTDVDVMLEKGIRMAPAFQVEDDDPMEFIEAVHWLRCWSAQHTEEAK